MDSQNIPCATLKRRGFWVSAAYLWIEAWRQFKKKNMSSKPMYQSFYQCCGSGIFILDPGSWLQGWQDPGSGSVKKKNLCIFNPKNWYQVLKNNIRDVHPGPRLWIISIPDPGSTGQKSTGSRNPDPHHGSILTKSPIYNSDHLNWLCTYSQSSQVEHRRLG